MYRNYCVRRRAAVVIFNYYESLDILNRANMTLSGTLVSYSKLIVNY